MTELISDFVAELKIPKPYNRRKEAIIRLPIVRQWRLTDDTRANAENGLFIDLVNFLKFSISMQYF